MYVNNICPSTPSPSLFFSPLCKFETPYGKSTAIPLKAVRETRVSRHHGVPIKGPLKPPIHLSTIILRGFKETLKWANIMPRDGSLSDSQCVIFQSGIHRMQTK